MSTTTTNYGFTLPAVADPIDEDLWGTELNSNFSSLDDILPTPSANKYGAIAVQNATDNGLDYITSQGTSGQVLVSNGDDALPSFQTISAAVGSVLMPVGTVYVNYSDATNPGTLFGFGTWSALTDRFLIGASGTYPAGSTGGATTHTLTASQIPTINSTWSWGDGAPGNTGTNTYAGASNSGVTATIKSGTGIATGAIVSNNTGGAPHPILNPYTAVYMWRRTA